MLMLVVPADCAVTRPVASVIAIVSSSLANVRRELSTTDGVVPSE
jgi:hypothetical protein